MFNQKNFSEFFAGIGLVRVALEAEGWKTLFANDIDPKKFDAYRLNFGQNHFKLDDIRNIKAGEVPNSLLATASFPCTDLSLAGAREGLNGSESGTLWSFLKIIEDMNKRSPKILLLENVPGFLSSNNGDDFEAAIRVLNKLGYSCDVILLNAVHFTPQSRQRLFVVAHKNEIRIPYKTISHPELLEEHLARPAQLLKVLRRLPHLNWRFAAGLPSILTSPATIDDVMEKIPEQSDLWWDEERSAKLFNQFHKRHELLIEQLKKQ
jgi:DNA (cytosine-5)-methyltransferase 1